jgi:hypothetical protein
MNAARKLLDGSIIGVKRPSQEKGKKFYLLIKDMIFPEILDEIINRE